MGLIAKVLDIMGLDILGTTCLVTSVAFLLCASQVKFKECLQFEQSVVEKFSSFLTLWAPTALSYIAKHDCGVNPCLLSSRSHLSTYITTRKDRKGWLIVNFDKG